MGEASTLSKPWTFVWYRDGATEDMGAVQWDREAFYKGFETLLTEAFREGKHHSIFEHLHYHSLDRRLEALNSTRNRRFLRKMGIDDDGKRNTWPDLPDRDGSAWQSDIPNLAMRRWRSREYSDVDASLGRPRWSTLSPPVAATRWLSQGYQGEPVRHVKSYFYV